jgi:hypothetical protein
MNIFYLERNAVECAQAHNNKHVVKMILEYAQILSTAHRVCDGEQYTKKKYVLGSFPARWRNMKRWKLSDDYHDSLLYQATHINHPSTIWARSSKENYIWLANLLISCCKEYTHRYDKTHKVEESGLCYVLLKNIPKNIVDVSFTEPAQAMPDKYKVSNDSITAYRNYYIGDKARMAVWKNRSTPEWYANNA